MRKYGWVPQLPDIRDEQFRSYIKPVKVPASVDLRGKMPPVYDQGDLGSCTANGIAAALQYEQKRQGETWFTPSRLFIYYNERVMEGTVNSDSGANIRDGAKSVSKQGACREQPTWPYLINKFKKKPSAAAYTEGLKFKSIIYHAIDQTLSQFEQHLAAGFPIIIGFSVYESFETAAVAKTGAVPMPKKNEQLLGGHCVIVVGYKSKRWVCRNCWGAGWGDKGYFTLPYAYLMRPDLASDFWVIEQVT